MKSNLFGDKNPFGQSINNLETMHRLNKNTEKKEKTYQKALLKVSII